MEKLNGRITISLLVVLLSIALAGLGGQAFAQESPAAGGDARDASRADRGDPVESRAHAAAARRHRRGAGDHGAGPG